MFADQYNIAIQSEYFAEYYINHIGGHGMPKTAWRKLSLVAIKP